MVVPAVIASDDTCTLIDAGPDVIVYASPVFTGMDESEVG